MSDEVKNDQKRGIKLKGSDKTTSIPSKVFPFEQKWKKPEWIRAKL
ncbi:lipoyl synthase, partial [Neisseria sp. P0013.S002]